MQHMPQQEVGDRVTKPYVLCHEGIYVAGEWYDVIDLRDLCYEHQLDAIHALADNGDELQCLREEVNETGVVVVPQGSVSDIGLDSVLADAGMVVFMPDRN